ncbi:hypothetical protein [Gemmobacter serpentinus]|uniref:hypothetical protein n=1 Tax=Gemmobacter serpentinus TaxID=2652247 RepID=UPI00124E5590|nr:hypothetical protein [Gemmobacter serpentinus]
MTAIPATRMGRLQFVAETLGVAVPDGLRPNLLSRDGAPAHAVIRFCATHGASLDFIYLGDVAILIRYTARAMLMREPA